MKKTLLSLLVAAGFVGSASAQYFSDNFSGNTIDPTKWNVLTINNPEYYISMGGPGYSYAQVSENTLKLTGGAVINSINTFEGPYTVSGMWNETGGTQPGIWLRTSGETNLGEWGTPPQITGGTIGISFNVDQNINIRQNPNGYQQGLMYPYPNLFNSWVSFSITDRGDKIDLSLNGSFVTSYSVSSIGYGNGHIAIQSQWNDKNGLLVNSVSVASIPEPSTFMLFGIGAIGMLMVLRRKKTV